QALKKFGAPIYVRHEVVHNRFVIDDLKSKGAIFVDNIADIPEGSHVIFSAHGVSKVVKTDAKNRKLMAIDATCPLVTKVHREVNKMYGENYHIIMIGHTGHPEVEGTMGQIEKNSPDASIHLIENKEDVSNLTIPVNNRVSYVSQTTLSVDDTQEIIEALKYKYPNIQGPKSSDICYATQNRQDSVKKMIAYQDIILVVGSANSSNSSRLVEIAKKQGIEAHLIDNPDEFDSDILKGKNRIGLTAGASAPEAQVQLVINFISQFNKIELTEIDGIEESITFKLPIF
ncbi:MAG: 4-hydroxy-3-methylbut-2-enyl diphosphate reductase, partial [Nitrosomonadales bacterium]|nr:4-hydroxy-3-methylbut-2-enyl diphosphate reductase [Nitrosomonadales bacterium]